MGVGAYLEVIWNHRITQSGVGTCMGVGVYSEVGRNHRIIQRGVGTCRGGCLLGSYQNSVYTYMYCVCVTVFLTEDVQTGKSASW